MVLKLFMIDHELIFLIFIYFIFEYTIKQSLKNSFQYHIQKKAKFLIFISLI